MPSPSLHPSTTNFRERLAQVKALLTREGLTETPEYSPITRLFGYERGVNEEVLSGVVVRCAEAGRPDLSLTLVHYLSEFELGRLPHALLDTRHDEVLKHVLPLLNKSQFSSFLYACMKPAREDIFDVVKPFLQPDMISSTLIASAAFNKATRFGNYCVENMDVLQALREIQDPKVASQVASWWAAAIEERRVPLPDLGRASKHWRSKFPELGAAMLTVKMEASLPPAAPSRKMRF